MSAASPVVPDKAQEPSMEEILASIRRIIADDQNAKADVGEPTRAVPPLPENDDDILDLAEVAQPVRKATPAPAAFEEPDIGFTNETLDFDAISFDDEPEPEPEPVRMAAPEPARAAPQPAYEAPEPAYEAPRQDTRHAYREPEAAERLTSSVTDASVGQAFTMLANTVLSSNPRTLEDLVQDMLRPMLKGWLDENLPPLVERLVRAEIERVARGR